MPQKDPQKRKEYQARRYAERRKEFIALEMVRYNDNREEIRKRRLELAYRHKDKNNERERLRYANWRAEVLSAYGNKCSCCGEEEILFLEIDHIDNNGCSHRKEIGRSAKALVKWIVDNSFPVGFQILCSNCNQGKKRNGGICPHKTKTNNVL